MPDHLKIFFCWTVLFWGMIFGVELNKDNSDAEGAWSVIKNEEGYYRHLGTGLNVPVKLGAYQLKGEYRFKDGDRFIRFENLETRARADLFFFERKEIPQEKELQLLYQKNELLSITKKLEDMVAEGKYRDIQTKDFKLQSIELWNQPALNLLSQELTVKRVMKAEFKEALLEQWNGTVIMKKFVLTLRHLQPEGGDAKARDEWIGGILQALKDPALRLEMVKLGQQYLEDPLSEEGEACAAAVLMYLEKNPNRSVLVPQEPLTSWLNQVEKQQAGYELHLLRAFMIGAAVPAIENQSVEICSQQAAKQLVKVYELLKKQNASFDLAALNEFSVKEREGRALEVLFKPNQLKGNKP
jgi:hypothetical protein